MTSPATRRMLRWLRRLLALLVAAPLLLWGYLQVSDGAFDGVRVGGHVVEERARAEEILGAAAQAWNAARVTVKTGPYVTRLTRAELGTRLDPRQAVARVRALGRSGNPWRDLAAWWAHSGDGLSLGWSPEIDRTALAAGVRAIRERVERPPVPGTLDYEGNPMPGIPGLTVNSIRAVATLTDVLRSDATEVELQAARIAPPAPVTYDEIAQAGGSIYTQVLQRFETEYARGPSRAGRVRNIELAAEAIDGVVIQPGQQVSFNEMVGERSYERGFRAAKELANRRVVEGIGGGVCQVAATLHAAAFLGAFEMPVYQPHSRPSRYIELGLDTMVAWPNRDLEVKNPYPFPVRVRAQAVEGVVTVELRGAGKPHPVEWDTEILSKVPAGDEEIVDEGLPAGETRLVQKGIPGLKVKRRRVVYLPTGPRVEEDILRYPPNATIVAVAPEAAGG
ncbi:MAG: VanW family protein [Myxococcales bacterium]|jgi:vancomycin resistance protein YoaR